MALTGGLTGPDPAAFEVSPGAAAEAYFAAGDADPWISPDRVRATAAAFAHAGCSTRVEITPGDHEHQIRASEVEAVRDILQRIAARLA